MICSRTALAHGKVDRPKPADPQPPPREPHRDLSDRGFHPLGNGGRVRVIAPLDYDERSR